MPVSEEKVLKAIKRHEYTTKESVLSAVEKKMQKYMTSVDVNPQYLQTYYALLVTLLAAFSKRIEASVLFDELPAYWTYGIDYQYDEFSLNIEHIKEYYLDDNEEYRSSINDAIYKLVVLKPTSFTVDQYSKFYAVGTGTVRQWIRRGKIRTAYKEGGEWKIPELSPPPSRGYESAQYKWLQGLDNLPDEYAFLADYVLATLYQDRKDKTKYHVLLVAKETFASHNQGSVSSSKNKELLLDAHDREKLELFMIAHPQIKYCGLVI